MSEPNSATALARQDVVAVVVVGAHDQLGQAGGATGQQKARDVGTGRLVIGLQEPRRGLHGGGQAVLGCMFGAGGGQFAVHEDGANARHLCGHLLRHLAQVGIGVEIGDGDRGCLGKRCHMRDFVPAVRRQRHDRNDPGAEARQGQRDELPRVGQLHDDPITRRHSQVEQGLGARGGPVPELLVRQPRRAVDQGLGVGLALDVLGDMRGERGALPVSGLAIRLGDLIRPRERHPRSTHECGWSWQLPFECAGLIVRRQDDCVQGDESGRRESQRVDLDVDDLGVVV